MGRYIKGIVISHEYNLAIKRNEILTHAMRWMNLENIMDSKRSDHKILHMSFLLYEISKIGKYMKTQNRLVVA